MYIKKLVLNVLNLKKKKHKQSTFSDSVFFSSIYEKYYVGTIKMTLKELLVTSQDGLQYVLKNNNPLQQMNSISVSSSF